MYELSSNVLSCKLVLESKRGVTLVAENRRRWRIVMSACQAGIRMGTSRTAWLERFEICAAANEWDKKTRALKLPTLLEKEALVAWLSIPEETRKDYEEVKQSLSSALKPNQFSSFAEFQARKLRPGETVYKCTCTIFNACLNPPYQTWVQKVKTNCCFSNS